ERQLGFRGAETVGSNRRTGECLLELQFQFIPFAAFLQIRKELQPCPEMRHCLNEGGSSDRLLPRLEPINDSRPGFPPPSLMIRDSFRRAFRDMGKPGQKRLGDLQM